MDLERLSINIRPRKGWEAVDLGLNLVQAHALAVMIPVGLVVFALLVLCLLIAPMEWWSWVPGVMLWWLKPVYDRVVLHVLSRAVFGEVSGWRQTLLRLPSLLWGNGLFMDLTLRRLQLARAFVLPVVQLESLRGSPRRKRIAVLNQGAGGLPAGLQLLWLHLETAVSLGLLFLVFVMVPEQFQPAFASAVVEEDSAPWIMALSTVIYALALIVMESFYAAAGFALYLNRRVQLEGWDLEIALRRMQRRFDLEQAVGGATALPALLFACLVTFMTVLPGDEARADGPYVLSPPVSVEEGTRLEGGLLAVATPSPPRASARTGDAVDDGAGIIEGDENGLNAYQRTINEILADKRFGYTESALRYRFDFDSEERDEPERDPLDLNLDGLTDVLEALPRVAEAMLWLGVAVIVVWMLVRVSALRRWFARDASAGGEREPVPDAVFGLDVRPESLPDDLATAVLALWNRGEQRAALALLYRGTLSRILRTHPLRLGVGATEGDVLRLCRQSLDGRRFEVLEQVTAAWQGLAYAHRMPTDGRVRALCTRWRSEFASDTSGDQR